MLLQIVLLVLPWGLRRPLLNAIFGFRIDRGARIGFSLIRPRRLIMAPGARIGHLTIVKGLERLVIEEQGFLGALNWVTAFPRGGAGFFAHLPDRDPSFTIAAHASVTARHLIDCTGGVSVGRFATVGGWGSQFVSHSIDPRHNRQDAEPISIGAFCFVGTRVVILKGARLPDRSILAAGSVLGKAAGSEEGLFSGVPASRVSDLDPHSAYFLRTEGLVR